ncbi:MAG: type VI secretion system contractile sheath small subunit [Nitrospira sp.]|nr:type VI secretion system contractile sheath small subunit [Nitrospira sp.]
MPPKKMSIHDLIKIANPDLRVNIFYEVKTGGSMVRKVLPFQVGVIADLSGKPKPGAPGLEKRQFVDINAERFDKVLKGISPELDFMVPNTLEQKGELGVQLTFSKMADFEPAQVVQKVKPLRILFEKRQYYSSLLAKASSNPQLAAQLEDMLKNTDVLQELAKEASTIPPRVHKPETEKQEEAP